MVCNCFHQAFYCTIAKSCVWPPPKLEAQVTSLPFKLPHRWARQHRPPLIFFPFVLGENKKTRREKTHAKFFYPFPPHVWLAPRHYHVQVIGAWGGSHRPHSCLWRWTKLAHAPPPPLVFSFLCLHFVGHVCVDFTIASKRRWARPTHPPHLWFFCFFVGIFSCPPLVQSCSYVLFLCKLQQHKEEHINHCHCF